MSATFNGTSSYLLTANNIVGGSTPTYPLLVGGWVKPVNVTADGCLFFLTDNAAAASLDYVSLYALGSVASDPIYAQVAAAGSGNSSFGFKNGFTAGSWIFVCGYYASASSRFAAIGSSLGAEQATTRNVTGITTSHIGVQRFDSGGSSGAYFLGSMAEAFVASGFSTGNITAIITKLAAGWKPTDIAELSPYLTFYQPMRAALEETGHVGPEWTNTAVTFASGDHPTMLQNPHHLLQLDMQDDAPSTTVVDESEYGNDGTLPTNNSEDISVAGPGGTLSKALHLDGTLDSMGTGVIIGTEGTICLIAKRNASGEITLLNDEEYADVWDFGFSATADSLEFHDGTTKQNIDFSSVASDSNYISIAMRWGDELAAGEIAFYVNGVYLETIETTVSSLALGTIASAGFLLSGSANSYYAGLQVYSEARTLEQIQTEAARGGLWSAPASLTQNTRNLLYGGH